MGRHKIVLLSMLILISLSSYVYAQDIYEEQLDKGLSNNEPYSYSLSKKASHDPRNAKQILKTALRHSPDTPVFYFELSKASLPGILESVSHSIEGIKAYKRNFLWMLSLTGLLYFSLLISFPASIAIILLIRFPMAIPLIAHDMGEDKKKLLIPLFLILLSVFGPMFFMAGMLFLTGLHMRRIDKTVVYLTLVLFLISPLLLKQADTLLAASSPRLKAIVAVNEGRNNKYALQVLGAQDDFASRFSYALAMKREGRVEEAIGIYNGILLKETDPRVHTNLGNAYLAIAQTEPARESYEKSLGIRQSAPALYNLSQILRDTFNFSEGEEKFSQATAIDMDMVSRFTSIASRNPNRFVIDETLSFKEIWKLSRQDYKEKAQFFQINRLAIYSLSALLIVLFYITNRTFKRKARHCTRCGVIFCSKCARKIPPKSEVCHNCHAFIAKPSGQPPKERVAQLLSIHAKKDKSKKILRVFSFALPGIAHIYSGRIFAGLIYLWLFLFLTAVIIFNPLLSTGLLTYSHTWLNLPCISLAVILYLISIISIQRRLY